MQLKKVIQNAMRDSKIQSNAGVKRSHKDDSDLIALLESSQAKIKVIGCGGGGGNTLQRMSEVGIIGAETMAINTDAQDLLKVDVDRKILIGKELTRGLGAGSDPSIGEAAARESQREIESALIGLSKLQKAADTIIVIPNDKILEIAPDLPLNAAFKVADEVLTNAVKGITEMITKPGLINLDFADLRTILERGGAAMIGLGESTTQTASSDSRALEAVENALTSPLLDVDISNAGRALINVVGGSDMTLREAEMIVEAVSAKISSNAHIIWGAMIDDSIPKNQIQAMVVIAGGKFPYLDGVGEPNQGPMDLGIQFAD